jgi:hypothetical protein
MLRSLGVQSEVGFGLVIVTDIITQAIYKHWSYEAWTTPPTRDVVGGMDAGGDQDIEIQSLENLGVYEWSDNHLMGLSCISIGMM